MPKPIRDTDIEFQWVKITNPDYKAIRDRHYVTNKGAQGQQVHFLVLFRGEIIGIASAGSATYGVAPRDQFFNLPKAKNDKGEALKHIVNNIVFRLETPEPIRREYPDLTPKVLGLWRKIITEVWFELYATVKGFETFVKEEELADSQTRSGKVYVADNWIHVGMTKGSAKSHRGLKNKQTRKPTPIKMIYVRRNEDAPFWARTWAQVHGNRANPSDWAQRTEEEKQRKKQRDARRKRFEGRRFCFAGGEARYSDRDLGWLSVLGSE